MLADEYIFSKGPGVCERLLITNLLPGVKIRYFFSFVVLKFGDTLLKFPDSIPPRSVYTGSSPKSLSLKMPNNQEDFSFS